MVLGGEFVNKVLKKNIYQSHSEWQRNCGVTLPSVRRNGHHSLSLSFLPLTSFNSCLQNLMNLRRAYQRLKKEKSQADLCCLPCSLGMKV